MANKILIPLQSLVSWFPEPPANRQAAVGAMEGLWKGLLLSVSQRLHCLLGPTISCPSGGLLLSLIIFVPRIRPMKTVSTGQVFSIFSIRLWRGFLGKFFSLLFPPILQLLSASLPGLEPGQNRWCLVLGPTVVLEKTLESPLDCKEIQPVHPKRNQFWVFFGRTDVEAEAPVFWPSDVKSWLIWKDSDVGEDGRQEEKGMTEDKMVRWHHQLNGHEFG